MSDNNQSNSLIERSYFNGFFFGCFIGFCVGCVTGAALVLWA